MHRPLLELVTLTKQAVCLCNGLHVPCRRISKAMMNRATKLLSEDERLTSRGVTASAVCPSWCRTGDGRIAPVGVRSYTLPLTHLMAFSGLQI